MKKHLALTTILAGIMFAGSAGAAPVIYNDNIAAGTAAFAATIADADGTMYTDTLSGLTNNSSWARTGYTIASTDGSIRSISNYLAPRGQAITISPYSPFQNSGLTFTFDTPINAFGLMIGDWGTCCQPSSLYISFDGGATRLVATSLSGSDNPGLAVGDGYRNFVAAIDDSSTFSTVTFYGDGFGEALYAGGTIYYATVDEGSVSNPVPEPAGFALLGAGLLGAGLLRRRKSAV